MVVLLKNRSTTLRPRLNIYNADKSDMGGVSNNTFGANLSHQVAAEPDTDYFVRVDKPHQNSSGDYTLTVKMQ